MAQQIQVAPRTRTSSWQDGVRVLFLPAGKPGMCSSQGGDGRVRAGVHGREANRLDGLAGVG